MVRYSGVWGLPQSPPACPGGRGLKCNWTKEPWLRADSWLCPPPARPLLWASVPRLSCPKDEFSNTFWVLSTVSAYIGTTKIVAAIIIVVVVIVISLLLSLHPCTFKSSSLTHPRDYKKLPHIWPNMRCEYSLIALDLSATKASSLNIFTQSMWKSQAPN